MQFFAFFKMQKIHVSKGLFFLSPCQRQEEIFFGSSLCEPFGAPEGKTYGIIGLTPWTVALKSLESLSCTLVHIQPPTIQENYHFSVPTSVWFHWLLF